MARQLVGALVLAVALGGCTKGAPSPTTAAVDSAPGQGLSADAASGGTGTIEDAGGDIDATVARGAGAHDVLADQPRFGFELYGAVREAKGNIVLSPASLAIGLGMAYGGARGKTAQEIGKVLHVVGVEPEILAREQSKLAERWHAADNIELKIANRMFVDKTVPLDPGFLAHTGHYRAEAAALDFSKQPEKSRRQLNAWVQQQTSGRITELVPQGGITEFTRVALVNTVVFKGAWASKFHPDATRKSTFTTSTGDKVEVPFMQQKGNFQYMKGDGVIIIELPYAGDTFSFFAILPESADGLDALEKRFTADELSAWRNGSTQTQLNVLLPKFRLVPAGSGALAKPLASLGMSQAFGDDADFTGIAQLEPPLVLAEVFQKAVIDVDEKGSEAVAATAVVAATKGGAPQIPEFRADRPFLFVILDKQSGAPLFLGRVVDPR